MKKQLPTVFEPAEVNNCTYRYRDAMKMIEDMRRLRRQTGWFASWVQTSDVYVFHMTEPPPEVGPDEEMGDAVERSRVEMFAQFEVPVRDVFVHLWPSRYPQDPSVDSIRTFFLGRQGPSKIANLINETARDEVLPEDASRWSRLLSDDLI